MEDLDSLWDVTRIAMLCMMSALIFGTYFDALFKEHKVAHVPCSVSLVDRANKFHVTLMDECEVVE